MSADERAAEWLAEREGYLSYVASRYAGNEHDEAMQNARVSVLLALRAGRVPEGPAGEQYLRGVVFRAVKQIAIGQRPELKEPSTPGHWEVLARSPGAAGVSYGGDIRFRAFLEDEDVEHDDAGMRELESELQLLWLLEGMPRELQYIAYHRAHGVPAGDLAADLGISAPAFSVRWAKALGMLRDRLGLKEQDIKPGVPKGISWNKHAKQWEVKMSHGGKRHWGGQSPTVEGAVVKLAALRERLEAAA